MKKILFLLTLLYVSIGSLAADDVVDSINNIKKNLAYLYGEGTMDTYKSADSLARTDLTMKIQEWVFRHTENLVDEDIDRRIARYVKTMTTRRADKTRVFAYIQKVDVMPLLSDMGINIEDSTAVRVAESPETAIPKKDLAGMLSDLFEKGSKPTTRNQVLEKLLAAKDFFELRKTMKTLIEQGAINKYGKRESCKQPEECYWVVYDRAGNIKAILGKGQKTRKNYKTNRNDSLSNYEGKGFAGIWFQIAEINKTKNV